MKRLLVLLVALVMAISACGGGDGEASDDTTAETTEATLAAGDSTNGEALYNGSCIACHGPEGAGVEGLGKPWVGSDFINSQTDAELFAFLLEGRPSDHPDNTTGVAMMPRGGNPSLTDGDLMDLIAYMRTLNP